VSLYPFIYRGDSNWLKPINKIGRWYFHFLL